MAESDSGGVSSPPPGGSEAHLLLAPAGHPAVATYCEEHLRADPCGEAAPLVLLAGDASPSRPPSRSGLVLVLGDSTRAGSIPDDVSPPAGGPASPPATVPVSDDLGRVGATLDRYLTDWSSAGYRPTVCVDSVSGLLAAASIPATYRFLYVLLHRVGMVGAAAHAHVDARDHEGEVIRTFYPLFDRVVSFRNGGPARP